MDDNCGTCPSRMLKCWQDMSGYNQFSFDKWKYFNVDGWGGYVLKEKLKLIKKNGFEGMAFVSF